MARFTLAAPRWPSEVLFALAGLFYVGLLALYTVKTHQGGGSYREDRHHTSFGPLTAFVPTIGMLVSAHYVEYASQPAKIAVVGLVVAHTVLVTLLLGHWLHGNLPLQALHPGYFLPTVAGSFIASVGLSLGGWHGAAEAAFGVGMLFWLVIGTLVFTRLFTGGPLPEPVRPNLSVLVSAPATAAVAWAWLNPGPLDEVGRMLLGVLLLMIFVQVTMLPDYLRLRFSPMFWAFTFPVAAATNALARNQ